MTAEPFLRKEGEGNSIAVRISDLKTQLHKKEQLARQYKEEETSILAEFKQKEGIQ